MALIVANAYHEIHGPYEADIQSTYKEYVKAVLEACTYLTDQNDNGLQISNEDEDWEVVKTPRRRSGLGLSLEKYHQWSSLDLSEHVESIRHHDGTRTIRPRTIPSDHPAYELQDFIRIQTVLYEKYALSPQELLTNRTSSSTQILDINSLHQLDYRMALMNHANLLVNLINHSKILPRCQEVDSLAVQNPLSCFQTIESSLEASQIERVFNYVLKETVKGGVFPEPLQEQGPVFGKPRYYIAWCLASITTDIKEAKEMIDEMVKCKLNPNSTPVSGSFVLILIFGLVTEQYFQGMNTLLNMDGHVIEKKSKLLDTINRAHELPE